VGVRIIGKYKNSLDKSERNESIWFHREGKTCEVLVSVILREQKIMCDQTNVNNKD
jgi:hypothetical protein